MDRMCHSQVVKVDLRVGRFILYWVDNTRGAAAAAAAAAAVPNCVGVLPRFPPGQRDIPLVNGMSPLAKKATLQVEYVASKVIMLE